MPDLRRIAPCLAALALSAPACAAAAAPDESTIPVFVTQLVVLLLAGRLLGELMQRLGQPAIMGQLLAGVLLGPSVLGAVLPDVQHHLFPTGPAQKGMLDGVAQLGILLLLLITGMEMDFARVRGATRAALSASVFGIAVPFACGVGLGAVMPASLLPHPGQRATTALFLGAALSISSVKIVAGVIRDLGFMRRTVGQIILAAAIVDDTLGWFILSMIIAFARHGTVEPFALIRTALFTLVFLVISYVVGRRAVYFLIRWTNDNLVSETPVITATLILMGACALITQSLGVQTVLGAFVAGVLIGQSPILTRRIEEQLRGIIVGLFMPVFFGIAGLSADLRAIATLPLLAMTLGFVFVASLGKFAGAFLGGALGGLTRAESLALACGMNARGSTEIILATIGLSVGALNGQLFTMILTMAVITTLCMPPMLRWAFARVPVRAAEREQIERAERAESGYVARLERLLLTTDDSPSGRLASYLVGLLAVPRGMPVTVVEHALSGAEAAGHEEAVRDAMEQAAESTVAEGVRERVAAPGIDLITRTRAEPTEEAIAIEARKGYDLLVIGIEPLLRAEAELQPAIRRIADSFERSVCVVSARGRGTRTPLGPLGRILLPVIGAAFSRPAADLALALAQSSGAPLTALYVPTVRHRSSWRGRFTRSFAQPDAADAMLHAVLELSRQYAVSVRTALGGRAAPDEAILRELRGERYDLVVLGVQARPGDPVFLGSTPGAVVQRSPCSLLLLSS